jgi:BirA family transcriptional regulator, biotin operon repressor / biotin---[acetyl-CoA-carboxylase] ligase
VTGRASEPAHGRAVSLGRPRLHLRVTDSTNERARALALAGIPHGALVTAAEQSAGRGRQGRTWTAPPGRALLMSLVLRDPRPLLPLAAAVAVAETAGADALIKWPNDILLGAGKVAGILIEGRPQAGWAVLGVGLNVALHEDELPQELRGVAATLGRAPEDVEPVLQDLLERLGCWLAASDAEVLDAWRARDALLDRPVRWAAGAGRGAGVDGAGRLVVALEAGGQVTLEAGEVHLGAADAPER